MTPLESAPDAASRSPHPLSPARQKRLLRSLDALRSARVATVWAPIGYGKHRLVDDWLASDAALRPIEVGVDDTVASVRSRINEIAPAELAIVVVRSDAVAANATLLRDLLALASAPRIRLLVASKIRPEFPVGTLASRGELVQLDAQALAYTIDDLVGLTSDARHLALAPREEQPEPSSAATIQVNAEQARRTVVRTDGWPAIVELVVGHVELITDQNAWSAHTLSSDGLGPATKEPYRPLLTTRSFQLVQSFIRECVIEPLNAEDQELLEQLSLLPVVDPVSASALTQRENAAAQLSRLQAIGVPIVWTPANRISLNPALRGHLRQHLLIHHPARRRQLTQQAVNWLAARGSLMEAVQVATEVGERDLAQALAIEVIARGLHRTSLQPDVARLRQLLGESATASLLLSVTQSSPSTVAEAALPGLAEWSRSAMSDAAGRLGASMLCLNAWRRAGYPSRIDVTAALALAENFTDDLLTDLNRAQVAALLCEYGLYQVQLDQYEIARGYLSRAYGLAQLADVAWVSVLAQGTLALIRATYGRFEAANELATKAINLKAATDFDDTALETPARLAEVLLKLDDQSPMVMIDTLRPLVNGPGHLIDYEAVLTALIALGLVSVGELQAAGRSISAFRMSSTSHLFDIQRLLLSGVSIASLLASGDVEGAEREMLTVRGLQLHSNAQWQIVFESHLALMQGSPRDAYEKLRPLALRDEELTSRSQLSVLQSFATMAALVGEAEAAEQAATRGRLLAERLGLGWEESNYPMSQPPSQQPTLTAAERKVLGNLHPGETLEDAAARLFVSPNTIKTHLRRIYRKLGVHDRDAALRRARALGIHSFD